LIDNLQTIKYHFIFLWKF